MKKITEFHIKIRLDHVLHYIDCKRDSEIYEEVRTEYDALLNDIYEKITPTVLLEFGSLADEDKIIGNEKQKEALFCILTVGEEVSRWSTKLFQEGNYLGGMLADAMADDYLFQMDFALKRIVIELCKEKGYGVLRRLEAPLDIDMHVQKTAWETTRAEEEIGLKIKESYMYDPVKTMCQVYLLQKGSCNYQVEHDCSRCSNLNCKMRNLSQS